MHEQIKEIIEVAIRGGFKEGENWKFVRANRYWAEWLDGNGTPTHIRIELYFLDPLFFKALGKAKGWGRCWRCIKEKGECKYCGAGINILESEKYASLEKAETFFRILFRDESLESAIQYLYEAIKNK